MAVAGRSRIPLHNKSHPEYKQTFTSHKERIKRLRFSFIGEECDHRADDERF